MKGEDLGTFLYALVEELINAKLWNFVLSLC